MIQKLSLLLVLTSVLSYGQLSVRNNNYVFVNDEIVFVENDINLNEASSTIYLRDDAQIIQGTGTTGNSGVGELSVYQEGNVNEYAHNFWCSPIGSKASNTANNPFGILMLNDVTTLTTSTPATANHTTALNGTSTPLNIEPNWIFTYTTGDSYSEWYNVKDASTIVAGRGFSMKGTMGSSSNQQYDFRGKPNTGEISAPVEAGKFTLVGNPYPSAMDALAYIHDAENKLSITGILHYWEQDETVGSHYLADYQGGYATYTIDITGTLETSIPAIFSTYNGDGSINTASVGTSTKTPTRYIPIGQGFMVEGSLTSSVKAKNSHRVYVKETNVDSEFFKTSNSKAKKTTSANSFFTSVPTDYKRFRLNVDFNNTYTRQIVQTFHATATNGFDYGLETKTKASETLNSDAYWENDEVLYIAEALAFDENLKIPLTIKVAKNMPLTIRIADVQNFEGSSPIYLHDIENNSYVNLTNQNFSANLTTGIYTNRFEITFNNNSLSTETNILDAVQVFQNNNVATLTINNPKVLNINKLQLFDVNGKLILNKNISSNESKQSFSTKSFSDGIYIVNMIFENNQILNKKIIITNSK